MGQAIVLLDASRQSLEKWALATDVALSSFLRMAMSVGLSLGNVLFDDILETLVGLDHLDDQVSLVGFDVLEDVLAEYFVFAADSAVEMGVFDVALKHLGANAVLVVNHMLDRNGDSVLVDEIFDQTLHFRARSLLEFDWGVGEQVFTLLVQVVIGNTEFSLIFFVQKRDVSVVIIDSVELAVGSSGLLASSGFGDQEFSFFFGQSSQSDSLALFFFEAEHELVSIIIV